MLLVLHLRTENSAAVGAWVLLEPNDAEQMGGTAVEGCGQNSQLGGSEAGGELPAVSSRRALRPNVRNLERVD